MLKYRDFVPALLEQPGIFSGAVFETLAVSLEAANTWIEEEGIDVINVETVVLPNIHDAHQDGSDDVELDTSGKMSSCWYQFIRVWYRT